MAYMTPSKIKSMRCKMSLTVAELAVLLGKDVDAVQAWEDGKDVPDRMSVIVLSRLSMGWRPQG